MKKKMLALAMALMLAVSCFAAFPASAAGETLTWSITSSDTVATGGTLDVTVSATANAPVEGFLLELSLPTGVTLTDAVGEYYLDELFTSTVLTSGFYVSEKNGVYSFLYAGFSTDEGETTVYPEEAIDATNKTALFTFNVTVNTEASETPIEVVTFVKGEAAFDNGTSYSEFAYGTTEITDVTVASAVTNITSEMYYVNEDTHLIYGVSPATTITDFIANCVGADDATFTMFDSSTLIDPSEYDLYYIGTGMIVQVGDLTYATVVFGEVDGYGEISDAGGFTIVNLAYGFTSISEIMSGMGYTGEENNYSLIESAINVAVDPYYEGINDGIGFTMVNYAYFGEVALDYETLRTDGILTYQEVLAV